VVTIAAKLHDHKLSILIQDSGLGISAEHIPHLFDRFYRVDKSRSRAGGGSGIGLTIARHLVEAHGGRIWATSNGPGQGSTFGFSLPTV
jgi:histidine kinase